jgi:hypothetical protein
MLIVSMDGGDHETHFNRDYIKVDTEPHDTYRNQVIHLNKSMKKFKEEAKYKLIRDQEIRDNTHLSGLTVLENNLARLTLESAE